MDTCVSLHHQWLHRSPPSHFLTSLSLSLSHQLQLVCMCLSSVHEREEREESQNQRERAREVSTYSIHRVPQDPRPWAILSPPSQGDIPLPQFAWLNFSLPRSQPLLSLITRNNPQPSTLCPVSVSCELWVVSSLFFVWAFTHQPTSLSSAIAATMSGKDTLCLFHLRSQLSWVMLHPPSLSRYWQWQRVRFTFVPSLFHLFPFLFLPAVFLPSVLFNWCNCNLVLWQK